MHHSERIAVTVQSGSTELHITLLNTNPIYHILNHLPVMNSSTDEELQLSFGGAELVAEDERCLHDLGVEDGAVLKLSGGKFDCNINEIFHLPTLANQHDELMSTYGPEGPKEEHFMHETCQLKRAIRCCACCPSLLSSKRSLSEPLTSDSSPGKHQLGCSATEWSRPALAVSW